MTHSLCAFELAGNDRRGSNVGTNNRQDRRMGTVKIEIDVKMISSQSFDRFVDEMKTNSKIKSNQFYNLPSFIQRTALINECLMV